MPLCLCGGHKQPSFWRFSSDAGGFVPAFFVFVAAALLLSVLLPRRLQVVRPSSLVSTGADLCSKFSASHKAARTNRGRDVLEGLVCVHLFAHARLDGRVYESRALQEDRPLGVEGAEVAKPSVGEAFVEVRVEGAHACGCVSDARSHADAGEILVELRGVDIGGVFGDKRPKEELDVVVEKVGVVVYSGGDFVKFAEKVNAL